MSRYIKPEVRELSAYTLTQYDYRHKMNQNENPLGYPEELKQEVLRRVAQADWARYPSFNLDRLRERIATYAGIEPAMVLPGNGSNELIYVALATTLTKNDHIVVPVPTFSLYKLLGRVMGATVHEVRMVPDDNFALPAGEIVETAQANDAKVVIICTPNNPTGTAYDSEAVRRVVAESGALVLIDEAYREFSEQDFAPLLDEFDNVVLLRTFSKAMAMGGLRVGYAITNEALATEIHKAKLPYALNLFSEEAAIVALEHYDHFEPAIDTLKRERTRVYEALQKIAGLHVYPSDANFFLVGFECAPEEVFHYLLDEHGILVRDVSHYPGLAGHLRLSLGTPDENNLLIEGLTRLATRKYA